MQKTQRTKISRDMWNDFNRTVFLIIGVFIGIISVCIIVDAFSVLKRESEKSYRKTEPASFSLWLNQVDDTLLIELKKNDLIEEFEVRRMVRSRILDDSKKWIETYLYVVDDFNNLKLNQFYLKEGKQVPDTGEILLESLSTNVVGHVVGERIKLKIPSFEAQEVLVSGTVTAPGLKPAWIEECAYGYITEDTFRSLGGSTEFVQVLFQVTEHKYDKQYIEGVAEEIKMLCESKGYQINRCEINEPGEHPNAKQIDALMFLFEIFAAMAMILSGVLIINLISVLLNGQRKQIGIMKAMGGTNISIAKMYYILVIRICFVASIVAIPMAYILSKQIVKFCGELLNIVIESYSIPYYLFFVEMVVGIGIPMVSATFVIFKYCNRSIKYCLYDEMNNSIEDENVKTRVICKAMNSSGTMAFSNAFRRWKRMLMTVITLSIGGAVFILSLNLRYSLNYTMDNAIKQLNYGLLVITSKNYEAEELREVLKSIDGVKSIEVYSGGMAFYTGEGVQSNSFQLVGLTSNAQALNFPVLSGRNLAYNGEHEAVINQAFHSSHSNINVGDTMRITTNMQSAEWKVVGIVKEIGGEDAVYVDCECYKKVYIKDQITCGREIALIMEQENFDEEELRFEVEKILCKNQIDVQNIIGISDMESAFTNHLKLISSFLMIISLLIISVGVIGLISLITVNLIERGKEVGVMMAIGAQKRDIVKVFECEGILIAVLSMICSGVIALPLTYYMSNVFGNIFLQVPLDCCYSFGSILIWMILVIGISILVNYIVVNKFTSKPVNQVLNYE